jgi:hypothetical protein
MPSQKKKPLIPAIDTGTILRGASRYGVDRLIGTPPKTREENPDQYDGLVTIVIPKATPVLFNCRPARFAKFRLLGKDLWAHDG